MERKTYLEENGYMYDVKPPVNEKNSQTTSTSKAVSFQQKLMVGALAGISGTSIVYPLDIIKTQIQSKSSSTGSSIIGSTLNAAKAIYAKNGIVGFYRGFGACLVGIAPEKAMKLAVNDAARDHFLMGGQKKLTVAQEIIAGSAAGFLQLFVTVPYEAIKIKLQMQGNLESAAQKSASQIIRETGFPGMYRGFTATLFRDVPFCLIFFPLYSNIKTILHKPSVADSQEPFHVGLVSGIIAGAISGVLVTPADMLKTRIQQGLSDSKGFLNLPIL